jgi:hypothetical protein
MCELFVISTPLAVLDEKAMTCPLSTNPNWRVNKDLVAEFARIPVFVPR